MCTLYDARTVYYHLHFVGQDVWSSVSKRQLWVLYRGCLDPTNRPSCHFSLLGVSLETEVLQWVLRTGGGLQAPGH